MKRFIVTLLFLSLVCAGGAAQERMRILVGTYTEGTASEGVYLYSFDTETASAELLGYERSGNPSFVIAPVGGEVVYAVNEFGDGRQGVSSFALEGDGLRPIGSITIPSAKVDGADPCNILYTGGAVVTSNYTGGSVTAFAVKDGKIEGMSQFYTPEETDSQSHMHCAVISPDRKYIFVTDLGKDCIHRFDRQEGAQPLGEEMVAWQNRSRVIFGPRHMVFSADGRFAYLLCELGDKLVVFSYDDGTLTPIQTLTAYKGKGHGSADIHISPDGNFLYTSHRLRGDGISVFRIDKEKGKVKKAGFQPTGKHPRNFAISPDGKWLLCACRDSNRIEIYSIDPRSGALTPTGKSIELGAPVCIQFVD